MNDNKRCSVVTSGARGIGAAITAGLIARGMDVVVADREEAALDGFRRPDPPAPGNVTLVGPTCRSKPAGSGCWTPCGRRTAYSRR